MGSRWVAFAMSVKPQTKSQTDKTPTGKAKAKGQIGKQADNERTVAAQTRHQTAANDTTTKQAASTPTTRKQAKTISKRTVKTHAANKQSVEEEKPKPQTPNTSEG